MNGHIQPQENPRGDDFDLLDFLQVLWRGRLIILSLCLLLGCVALAYALLARKQYQAEVVMVQSEQRGLSASLGQLGSLASLAGINLSQGNADSQKALAVLKSQQFAREFIEDRQLLTVLLQDDWDEANNRWKPGILRLRDPDVRDAVDYFQRKVMSVSEDVKSGVLTLSVVWRDAVQSADWANDLVHRANERLRGQALTEAEHNIEYLQSEIAATNISSLQQSIGKVLESEMQKLLLARGSEEFAFKVVDRAYEPKKHVSPIAWVLGLASVLLGLLVSVVFLMFRESLRSRAADRRAVASS